MPSRLRSLVMLAAVVLGCRERSPAEPPPRQQSDGTPVVASAAAAERAAPSAADWRSLAPPDSRIEQTERADLDGDGVQEVIAITSAADPDLLKTEGVGRDEVRMNLELLLWVLASHGGRYSVVDRTEMTGGFRRVLVRQLRGDEKRRFVVGTAMHCGGSCAGMEVHVLGVTNGIVKHLLDEDTVADAAVTRRGLLAITEASSAADREAPREISYYAVSGAELVRVDAVFGEP